MIELLWSVAILGVTLTGILGVRALPERVRVAFDVVCLAAAGVVLYQHTVTPLMLAPIGAANSPAIWLRAVAVAWWILSARVIVAALYYTLRIDRKSREAKLPAAEQTSMRAALQRYDGIGIRIEDDVLITSGEPKLLSSGAPRTVAEIEALMAAARR